MSTKLELMGFATADVFSRDVRGRVPVTKRAHLQMGTLTACIAKLARPLVEAALGSEVREAGAQAWTEEGERALRQLLRDEGALENVGLDVSGVLGSLRQELDNPMPPDDDEISDCAAEVGSVMASSWLQCLALALRTKDEIRLGAALLPRSGEVDEELWQALHSSLNGLVIGIDEAAGIMQALAQEVVAEGSGVDLPMGVAIDVEPGPRPSYVARRR